MSEPVQPGNRTTEPGALLDEAGVLHRQGALEAAADRYTRVLQSDPANATALYHLAQICCRQGHFTDGVAWVRRALVAEPRRARLHVLEGRALAALGDSEQALASFDRAIACDAGDADAHGNRGDVLAQVGRLEDAAESYRRALAVDQGSFENWCNLGAAQAELGRHDEALVSYGRVLELEPGFAEAHVIRGNLLARLGRRADALASLERALALTPDHVAALVSCGDVLRGADRHQDALARYDRALSLEPTHAPALSGRAAALVALKRFEEAIATLDRALALDPSDADALCNRGFVLQTLNRLDDALATLDRALAIDPDHAGALSNRGMVLLDLGRPAEAVHCYRRAMAIKPSPGWHSNLIFALNFDPAIDGAEQQAERARWGEQHATPLAAAIKPHRNSADPDRRLRIGYLSSHFRHQAATYAFASVILNRDRGSFEAVCYANAPIEDDVGERLRASADAWRPIDDRPDEEVAELIRADGIDILVDLVGHMSGQRLMVFARKPAPVQVTGWGEPTGTGLRAMDYLLADSLLVPSEQRPLLAERVYDLPNFLGYWTPDHLPDPTALPAMTRGFVTFGSFNRVAKIQDPVVRRWAAILRAVPTARLVIKSEQRFDDSCRRSQMDAIFAEEGVAAGRVDFLGPCGRAAHFAAYQAIDIALDPFPHGGGMTTLDALWMGIPVITLPGRTISSRLAASSLNALGLTSFIADSSHSYIDRAVATANDLASLARFRAGLRERVAHSVVGDPDQYARAVETAYRAMWRAWCAPATGT